ncbi:MAG TPA: anti-sigma factor, partial [Rhodoglobus sp.]|nr:anti-sigma factor [Rhodoglobus sp.]
MTSDKELGNLSGSYALNGLDAADLAEFETHLQQSHATRDEVTELTDTAVLLGLATRPVQPSTGLKASIMDQLDAHPQLPVAASSAA